MVDWHPFSDAGRDRQKSAVTGRLGATLLRLDSWRKNTDNDVLPVICGNIDSIVRLSANRRHARARRPPAWDDRLRVGGGGGFPGILLRIEHRQR